MNESGQWRKLLLLIPTPFAAGLKPLGRQGTTALMPFDLCGVGGRQPGCHPPIESVSNEQKIGTLKMRKADCSDTLNGYRSLKKTMVHWSTLRRCFASGSTTIASMCAKTERLHSIAWHRNLLNIGNASERKADEWQPSYTLC